MYPYLTEGNVTYWGEKCGEILKQKFLPIQIKYKMLKYENF